MSSQIVSRWLAAGALVLLILVGMTSLGNAFAPQEQSQEGAPSAAAPQPSSSKVCTGERHIRWPAKNPVWELCWVPPTASSGEHVGRSGLELINVRYKGKRVLWRAHTPILNARYHEPHYASCGPHYRDWQYELAPFDPRGEVKSTNYALVKEYPPITTADHPGSDGGTFKGVAVYLGEKFLSLTTTTKAGWYRYIQEWRFYPDGLIEPRYAFSAVNNPCISKPHDHHVYWRLDFDIDGPADDVVEVYHAKDNKWVPVLTETRFVAQPGDKWRVLDKKTKRGYEVIPGKDDHRIQDAFSVGDVWALRCHENPPGNPTTELSDGGIPYNMPGGGTAAENAKCQLNKYLNKESLDGQDVVLWYRTCARHVGPLRKEFHGPQLKPVGNW
jgi:hypothetical protein